MGIENSLNVLMKESRESTKYRQHKMSPWLDVTKEYIKYSACEHCGMEVWVNAKPLPNEIDVGGQAVALNCYPDVDYFDMSLTFDDLDIMVDVFNQGIDSRLEGFTQSRTFHKWNEFVSRLECRIHPAEMQILIRRLLELETEQAEMLADDIVRIYYDEEII